MRMGGPDTRLPEPFLHPPRWAPGKLKGGGGGIEQGTPRRGCRQLQLRLQAGAVPTSPAPRRRGPRHPIGRLLWNPVRLVQPWGERLKVEGGFSPVSQLPLNRFRCGCCRQRPAPPAKRTHRAELELNGFGVFGKEVRAECRGYGGDICRGCVVSADGSG